jgi:hypothetical protein
MAILVQELKDALPSSLKTFATQELADKIDQITTDPLAAKLIQDNFISYTHVLQEGKYKMDDYLSAVSYVSFKLMGLTNKEAYCRTFPNRYSNLIASGKTEKEISCYVAAFHKGKLVNQVMEQCIIPAWVLHNEYYNEAIRKNVELMRTARSEKVQAMAADSLLKHLAKPEAVQGPLVNIDMRQGSGLDELKEAITSLARKQRELIIDGIPTKEIAEQKLYEQVN